MLKGAEATALDATGRISIDERHAAGSNGSSATWAATRKARFARRRRTSRHYIENVDPDLSSACAT